jgi:hypothetical protein
MRWKIESFSNYLVIYLYINKISRSTKTALAVWPVLREQNSSLITNYAFDYKLYIDYKLFKERLSKSDSLKHGAIVVYKKDTIQIQKTATLLSLFFY